MEENARTKDAMRKLINFLLYCGLTKDEYRMVADDVREENRRTVAVFSLLGFFAFLIAAIAQSIMTLGANIERSIFASIFCLILSGVATWAGKKKIPIGKQLAYLLMVVILITGAYSGIDQPHDKTVLLLVFYSVTSILFTLRLLSFIVIVVGVEALYLGAIYQTQYGTILQVNATNSIIFCLVGIMSAVILMQRKHESFLLLQKNRILMERDALTNLYNRYSYKEEINRICKEKIPVDVISMDVNGLKAQNDLLGHAKGDELIIGASLCMTAVLGEYGKVFRTGGDEFVAILDKEHPPIEQLIDNIKMMGANRRGRYNESVSVSCGFASSNGDYESMLSETLQKADERMYEDKRLYYQTHNVDRRK